MWTVVFFSAQKSGSWLRKFCNLFSFCRHLLLPEGVKDISVTVSFKLKPFTLPRTVTRNVYLVCNFNLQWLNQMLYGTLWAGKIYFDATMTIPKCKWIHHHLCISWTVFFSEKVLSCLGCSDLHLEAEMSIFIRRTTHRLRLRFWWRCTEKRKIYRKTVRWVGSKFNGRRIRRGKVKR